MIDVARSGSGWAPDESAHLETCSDCAAEWRLIGRTAALGSGMSIDAERISARVRARLATPDEHPIERPGSSRRRWIPWAAIGLAAAAALVLAVRPTRGPHLASPPPAAETGAVLSELDGLSARELETVLSEMENNGSVPGGDGLGLGDLTTAELERVLRSWGGSNQ
jgi:hypothetical protein